MKPHDYDWVSLAAAEIISENLTKAQSASG
jgi:hypothetical protein